MPVTSSRIRHTVGADALGPAIAYRARSGDDTDQRIATIVREIGPSPVAPFKRCSTFGPPPHPGFCPILSIAGCS